MTKPPQKWTCYRCYAAGIGRNGRKPPNWIIDKTQARLFGDDQLAGVCERCQEFVKRIRGNPRRGNPAECDAGAGECVYDSNGETIGSVWRQPTKGGAQWYGLTKDHLSVEGLSRADVVAKIKAFLNYDRKRNPHRNPVKKVVHLLDGGTQAGRETVVCGIKPEYATWDRSEVTCKRCLIRQNPDEDIRKLERLAAQGDSKALGKLAKHYFRHTSPERETCECGRQLKKEITRVIIGNSSTPVGWHYLPCICRRKYLTETDKIVATGIFRNNPDEDIRKLERLAAQGDPQAIEKLARLNQRTRHSQYSRTARVVRVPGDPKDTQHELYKLYVDIGNGEECIGAVDGYPVDPLNDGKGMWWARIYKKGIRGLPYHDSGTLATKEEAIAAVEEDFFHTLDAKIAHEEYLREIYEQNRLEDQEYRDSKKKKNPPMRKKKSSRKSNLPASKSNPPDGLKLSKARQWLAEAVAAYAHGTDKEYLPRLIQATRPADRDKLKAEAEHLYRTTMIKQANPLVRRSNPGLAIIHAGAIVNPPRRKKNPGHWDKEWLNEKIIEAVENFKKGNLQWAGPEYRQYFTELLRDHPDSPYAKEVRKAITKWENWSAKKANPPHRKKNPPKRRNRPMGSQTGGVVDEISLEDYIAEYGMNEDLEKAIKAYKKFHQAEPSSIKVIQYDDNSDIDQEKYVMVVGQAPETHYVLPKDQLSNKNGSHWVHHHKKGHLPYLVVDPATGIMMTVGGVNRTTTWLYD